MGDTRTQYSNAFKFEIGVLALSNTMSIGEISSQYGVHSSQIASWKKQLQEQGGSIFERKNKDAALLKAQAKKEERLYKQIGKLTVENDWLKKKSALFPL